MFIPFLDVVGDEDSAAWAGAAMAHLVGWSQSLGVAGDEDPAAWAGAAMAHLVGWSKSLRPTRETSSFSAA